MLIWASVVLFGRSNGTAGMAGHAVLILLGVLSWLTVSIAVGVDAIRRGRTGGVWGITVFLLGPIGLFLYVLVILTAGASIDEDNGE